MVGQTNQSTIHQSTSCRVLALAGFLSSVAFGGLRLPQFPFLLFPSLIWAELHYSNVGGDPIAAYKLLLACIADTHLQLSRVFEPCGYLRLDLNWVLFILDPSLLFWIPWSPTIPRSPWLPVSFFFSPICIT